MKAAANLTWATHEEEEEGPNELADSSGKVGSQVTGNMAGEKAVAETWVGLKILLVGVGSALVALLPGKGARHREGGQGDGQATAVGRAGLFQITEGIMNRRRDETSTQVLTEDNKSKRSRSSKEARGEIMSWFCNVEIGLNAQI